MIAGIQKKAIDDGVEKKKKEQKKKNEIIEEGIRSSQRMALEGQNPKQRWDCSHIENEEEEEGWQEGDQMAEQWEEEQH